MRIASLCPSNTELAAYLGLSSSIMAVDDYSDWPSEITHLPRLGPDLSINIDKLESLNPDLILASLSVPGMEKNIEKLKERNLPHVIYNPNSLSEIANNVLDLGKLTGKQEKANRFVDDYYRFVERYKKIASTFNYKKTLYWEWWPKPVFTPGGQNWLTEISALAGGINLFQDKDCASVQTTWDDVLNREPDVINLVWVGVDQSKVKPDFVTKRKGWDTLYKKKQPPIQILEESLFCRPSPRLLHGLKKLAHLLHPDVFPEYDGVDTLLEKTQW